MDPVGVSENKGVDNSELFRNYLPSAPPVPPLLQDIRPVVPSFPLTRDTHEGVNNISQTRYPDVSSVANLSCNRVQAHSSESPEENRVPLQDESQDQDGDGFLFERSGSWGRISA